MVLSRWGQRGRVGFRLFLELEPPWSTDGLDAVWERTERSQGQFRGVCPERQGHPSIIKGAPWEGQVLWWGTKSSRSHTLTLRFLLAW